MKRCSTSFLHILWMTAFKLANELWWKWAYPFLGASTWIWAAACLAQQCFHFARERGSCTLVPAGRKSGASTGLLKEDWIRPDFSSPLVGYLTTVCLWCLAFQTAYLHSDILCPLLQKQGTDPLTPLSSPLSQYTLLTKAVWYSMQLSPERGWSAVLTFY